jgi:DNA-binding MarR family transcriptional regulator
MKSAAVESGRATPPDSPRLDGRAAREAERVQHLEQAEPLRARILERLVEQPSTPTELASFLGAHKESVSRILRILREEELVEVRRVVGDRRRRRYVLTPAGTVELSRHHAYGDPEAEQEQPSAAEGIAFLRSALAASVSVRRTGNELEEAAERQRRILREAEKERDGELIVEAKHELATTLRQAKQESMVEELLDDLDEIALGRGPYSGSELSLQAAAHRAYGLGRLREGEDPSPSQDRLEHLIAAASNYRDLADGSEPLHSIRWRERQGWSMISLAANLRAGTRVEEALSVADRALGLFEEIEDSYGRSHSLFLIGFCLRLLGDYDSAWFWLTEANALAEEHSYKRFQADSLLQIGEVLRCRGDLDSADEALEGAREQATRMGLQVIQAYAHSALGAVAFQRGEPLEAQLELNRAQEQFSGIVNREGLILRANEGLALNDRRLASVMRVLAKGEGGREKEAALRAAERRAKTAEKYYYTRRKPAGVAASQIEQDRLRMIEGREPELVDELLALLGDPHRERERGCLELDPWVPGLLRTYAVETGNAALTERSESLLQKAKRRLGEAAQQVRSRRPVGQPEAVAFHQDQADDMGGEPRRIRDQTEATVVV